MGCFDRLLTSFGTPRSDSVPYFPQLAPSADILSVIGNQNNDWPDYELVFLNLMRKPQIQMQIDPAIINGGFLLCSESTRHYCHRRLVVDYLQQHWGGLSVVHLG